LAAKFEPYHAPILWLEALVLQAFAIGFVGYFFRVFHRAESRAVFENQFESAFRADSWRAQYLRPLNTASASLCNRSHADLRNGIAPS
jgi:hypothetical protein